MKISLLLLLLLSSVARADCVILLHGLARSASSMETMAEALQEAGFSTVNVDYPSTEHAIEALAPMSIDAGLEQCDGDSPVHFVTHSLGGILIRQYLSQQDIPQLGRVVMLGPPNGGSEVVDSLGDFPGFYLLNGEAGQQLGTGAAGLPRQLGPANFEVGIIAGNSSINLILSSIIPGADDGKVSVSNARLEGMADFIVLPVSHPFLMTDPDVISQTLQFLRQGHFNHATNQAGSTIRGGYLQQSHRRQASSQSGHRESRPDRYLPARRGLCPLPSGQPTSPA